MDKHQADYSDIPLDLSYKKVKIEDETISEQLLSLENTLCLKLQKIAFRLPIEYIYNPLEYAYNVHAMYVHTYGDSTKKILFLGMNPGPWGMSQTGVPFGEISMVRDWLKISGCVGKPAREQPDRKVTGFECPRSEISGKRFWGLFQDLCGNPENFFRYAYLHNYCPFALMDGRGRNITPAELKGEVQKELCEVCDEALAGVIRLLKVQIVIGIGRFAEKRAQVAIGNANLSVTVQFMPHPSPRATHNENWSKKATQKLDEFGLLHLFKN